MKRAMRNFLLLLTLLLSSGSWVPQRRIGILTDDYGIVSSHDLDQEEARCTTTSPFPPKDNLCFRYWQCLPTHEFYIDCDDIGESDEFEHVGEAVFWIKDGENIHHFVTRRNFSLQVCNEWASEWRSVIDSEEIVCLSGDFIKTGTVGDHPSSPEGLHFYWIIDRMKSRTGEWSYFYRDKMEK